MTSNLLPLTPSHPHTLTPSQVSATHQELLSSRSEQEVELKELRQNRELLTQWERQIADIIQWVTEEKDARYGHMIVTW